jgi:hypothetical protein
MLKFLFLKKTAAGGETAALLVWCVALVRKMGNERNFLNTKPKEMTEYKIS